VDTDLPGLLAHMRTLLASFEEAQDARRHFLATYLRTTVAVAAAIEAGHFEDPQWVERWDVDFAGLYLEALEASRHDPAAVPRPWRLAFGARADLTPEAHVLLGMNAHINYDLPRSLVRVIPPSGFAQPDVAALRRRDHERIDDVLTSRVPAEDAELERAGSRRTVVDRVLAPVNREATRRLLREARRKVWHNARALDAARGSGDGAYRERVRDLDALTSARVAELMRPGPVLVRLAVAGFGVTLPPA
jgi:hypothetical protein